MNEQTARKVAVTHLQVSVALGPLTTDTAPPSAPPTTELHSLLVGDHSNAIFVRAATNKAHAIKLTVIHVTYYGYGERSRKRDLRTRVSWFV